MNEDSFGLAEQGMIEEDDLNAGLFKEENVLDTLKLNFNTNQEPIVPRPRGERLFQLYSGK